MKGFHMTQQDQQQEKELGAIFAQHPVPWGTVTHPNGLVQVHDSRMVEVPIFAMTHVLEVVTGRIAAQKGAKQHEQGI